MVNGVERFIEYFKAYQDEFVLIGGFACAMHYQKNGRQFRQTNDIDIVLIIENMSIAFYEQLWKFFEKGAYVSDTLETLNHHYYRFETSQDTGFPRTIELFSRKAFVLDKLLSKHLTPIHIDENTRSLSAIVLDDDYYHLIRRNSINIAGLPVLSLECIVILKSKHLSI